MILVNLTTLLPTYHIVLKIIQLCQNKDLFYNQPSSFFILGFIKWSQKSGIYCHPKISMPRVSNLPWTLFLLVVYLGIFPILSKLVLWLTFTKIAGVSVVDNIYHKTPQCQHSSLCPSCGACANIQKRWWIPTCCTPIASPSRQRPPASPQTSTTYRFSHSAWWPDQPSGSQKTFIGLSTK